MRLKAVAFFVIVLSCLSVSLESFCDEPGPVGAYGLKCEHLVNPLGIDASEPRLSWMMIDNRNGARQVAYKIILGTDSASVASGKSVYWESPKIASTSNLHIYKGKALQPFTKYYWRVILW